MKSIVAGFGAVLLVLSFALWGVPGLSNFVQRPTMRVGNAPLSPSMIQSEYSRAIRMKREENGGKFTSEDARAQGLGDQVVRQITTRSILEQEAGKLGLVMSNDIVKKYIETNESFQNPTTGKFDGQRLAEILRSNELSEAGFEDIIRKELLRDQLVSSLMAGPPAAEAFFAPSGVVDSIRARLERLGGLDAKGPTYDALRRFLRVLFAASMLGMMSRLACPSRLESAKALLRIFGISAASACICSPTFLRCGASPCAGVWRPSAPCPA